LSSSSSLVTAVTSLKSQFTGVHDILGINGLLYGFQHVETVRVLFGNLFGDKRRGSREEQNSWPVGGRLGILLVVATGS
jgi:hypothetical protein